MAPFPGWVWSPPAKLEARWFDPEPVGCCVRCFGCTARIFSRPISCSSRAHRSRKKITRRSNAIFYWRPDRLDCSAKTDEWAKKHFDRFGASVSMGVFAAEKHDRRTAGLLPVFAELLVLRGRGPQGAWSQARIVARGETNPALPSLGWRRPRSRADKKFWHWNCR